MYCGLCNTEGHWANRCPNPSRGNWGKPVTKEPENKISEPVKKKLTGVVLQRSVTDKTITRQDRWKKKNAEKFKEQRRKYMQDYRKAKKK